MGNCPNLGVLFQDSPTPAMVSAAPPSSEFPLENQHGTENLVELLSWRAQHQPQQVAYRFLKNGEMEVASLTYGQLDHQARAVALQLLQQLQPGDRALLLYPAGLEFIVAFLGCLYAGIVAVPAYPPRRNQNRQRLQAILQDCQANVILTSAAQNQEIKTQLEEIESWTVPPLLISDLVNLNCGDQWQPLKITSETLAFLQYTSGSTGNPRGVMVTHGNLWQNQRMIQAGFGHGEQTTIVSWLPLFHDMGLVGNVLQPLYLGIPSILMPPAAFLQRPIRWLQAISHYRATTSGGPNFAYDLCLERIQPEQIRDLDLSCWQVAFNGAEPVRADTLQRFAQTFAPWGFRWQAFFPCYGLAETTLFVTGGPWQHPPLIQSLEGKGLELNQVILADPSQPETRQLVGCGQPWLETEVLIVDPETQRRCAPEEIGEIWVAGDQVAAGYWEQPEATASTFQARLRGSSKPFLRTGDLGFLLQGQLFITGRCKDVLIIRGQNHYPQDIEFTVQHSHPALRMNSGAAFTVSEAGLPEQLVIVQEIERTALQQLPAEKQRIFEAICAAVSEEHELQVSAIRLLKPFALPKTSSGKVQRSACRLGYLQGDLQEVASWQRSSGPVGLLPVPAASPEQPQTVTQKQIQTWLVQYLARNLQLDPADIDPEKAFAAYGLDSAVAVSMTTDLGDWLNLELEVMLFWEYPTITSVAQYLETACHSLLHQQAR